MTKYAVHNYKVAFVCKKVSLGPCCVQLSFRRHLSASQAGSATPDLSSSSTSSVPQAANLLYGTAIGKALLQVTCGPDPDAARTTKDAESWKAEVVFTNASYQAKKFIFLLFINRTFPPAQKPSSAY
jgi:DNA mismatch repair protein MLH1